MGSYRINRHIAAPPERVFEAFTDPALIADWMDARAVTDVTGPLDVAGASYTLVIRGPWQFRMEVVRVDAPTLHEITGKAPLGTRGHMVATLTPSGEGSTDLDLLTEYRLPFGALGRWVDRRWIDREPRTSANREVDRLVELVSGNEPLT